MGQYEDKKKAYMIIDEMLAAGKPRALIVYKIATSFGFSERIVDKRIKMIKEMQDARPLTEVIEKVHAAEKEFDAIVGVELEHQEEKEE